MRLGRTPFAPGFTALAFFIVALIVFFPSLHGEWIMDDWGYISQNPWITTSSTPWPFWSTLEQPDYWPLSYTLYWLMYAAFGANSLAFHLLNVAVHALNGWLVWRLGLKLFCRAEKKGAGLTADAANTAALWAALLFLLHPLNVQAVSWMVQSKTLLSTTFALVSVIFYLRRSLAISWVAFLVALLFKTSVVTLPVVLFLLSQTTTETTKRRAFRELTPHFLLALILGVVTLTVNQFNTWDRSASVFQMNFWERLPMAVQMLSFYLSSFAWPNPLAFMYPLVPLEWTSTRFWLLLVLLGGLVTWLSRKRWPQLTRELALVYVIALLPALGLIAIPNMKLSLAADHWTYWPNVFLCLALPQWLLPRLRPVHFVLLLPLAWLSYQHARTFATEIAFWQNAQLINPAHAAPWYNLGTAYEKKQLTSEALNAYENAIRVDPKHSRAWFNRGYLLAAASASRWPEAERHVAQAVELDPQLVRAYLLLADLKQRQGHPREDAKKVILKGLERNPESPELRAWLNRNSQF